MKKEKDDMIVMITIIFIFLLKDVSSINRKIDNSSRYGITSKSSRVFQPKEIDLASKAISLANQNETMRLVNSERLLMSSGGVFEGSSVFLELPDSSNSTGYQTDSLGNSTNTNTTDTKENSTDTEYPFNRANVCSDFCPFTSSFFCRIIFGCGENNGIPFVLLGVVFLVSVLVTALFSLWKFRGNTQRDNPEMVDKKNGAGVLKNDIERNQNISRNQSRGRRVYSNDQHLVPAEVAEAVDSYPQIPEDHQTLVKSKIFLKSIVLLKFNPEPAQEHFGRIPPELGVYEVRYDKEADVYLRNGPLSNLLEELMDGRSIDFDQVVKDLLFKRVLQIVPMK